MSGAFQRQASSPFAPTSSGSDAFGASGVNTGAFDAFSIGIEKRAFVWVKVDQSAHFRAGPDDSVAATAGDVYLSAGVDYSFLVDEGCRYFSFRGAGEAGTAYIARSSG